MRRRNRRWPDKRAVAKQYSRKYLTESAFQDVVEGVLAHSGLEYVRECRLFGCRTRVDFRLADNSFLECKVAVNSGQTIRVRWAGSSLQGVRGPNRSLHSVGRSDAQRPTCLGRETWRHDLHGV